MSGLWTIRVPPTSNITNLWTNPGIELNATGYVAVSSTLIRVLTLAHNGIASLSVVTSNATANEGWQTATGVSGIAVSPSTYYSLYCHFYGASGAVQLWIAWFNSGGSLISNSTSSSITLSPVWTRGYITAQSPATAAYAALRCFTPTQQSITFYVDDVNFVTGQIIYTHIDGDQPGCYWTGLRHASTSVLTATERSAGADYDLDDTYGIQVNPSWPGTGMPAIQHNTQPLALLPGSLYQSYKVQPRVFDLGLHIQGATFANLFEKRKDLIDLIKPDAVKGAQPVVLGYKGAHASKVAYTKARYDGGAEFGGYSGFTEEPVIRLLATDPFWYAEDQEVGTLDFQDSLSTNRAAARVNGVWTRLGVALANGFDGAVNAIAVDKQRGRVYFGGAFVATAGTSPITLNGIGYWDGSQMVAMGGTPGVSGGTATVYAIAIAPNGDVYVGGNFTAAGGSTADGFARFNVAAGTWTQYTQGTPGDIIYAIAIDGNGLIYAAGNFINWNANANSDYIFSFDGSSTFNNLSTPPFSATEFPRYYQGLAVDSNNVLWAGGVNTGAGTGSLYKWNGSAWTTVATTDSGSGNGINCIAIDLNDDVYAGGKFTTLGGVTVSKIALYNGSAIAPVGSGLSDIEPYAMAFDANRMLTAGGNETSGIASIFSLYHWVKGAWVRADIDLDQDVTAVAYLNNDLYIGAAATDTTEVSGFTTVTNNGTALAYPILTIINANSSGTCTLAWLENQSTGQRWFFNLKIQAGETISIDTQSEAVTSDWRGRIYGQPLAGSDTFYLLPGANTIAAFITGTITSVTMQLRWTPRYWSLDGVAA